MKFVIAVVMLALALGAQSGVVPLSYVSSPLSYTAVSGPTLYAASPAGVATYAAPAVTAYAAPGYSAYAAPAYSAYAAPAYSAYAAPAYSAYAAPAYTAYSAPATVTAYSAPAVVAAEGSYVAQNRGAVHVAPLPGHANSATSVNLEPAPGTL